MAIDDQHKVISFDLFPNMNNLLSIGAQTTVALVSDMQLISSPLSSHYHHYYHHHYHHYYHRYTIIIISITVINVFSTISSFIAFHCSSYPAYNFHESINVFKESVTIIPKEKWSIEYIMPAEHCVKSKTGCLQTTYHIHSNAIRVDAEKSGQGMRPSLAMDPSVHAAYLVGDGVRKLTTPVNRACYVHSS